MDMPLMNTKRAHDEGGDSHTMPAHYQRHQSNQNREHHGSDHPPAVDLYQRRVRDTGAANSTVDRSDQ
jgi:hypothetical protein